MTRLDDLPDEEVWVTGGVRIPLFELSDQHLTNARAYLTRKLTRPARHLLDGEVDDMSVKLLRLESEAKRRRADD